MFLRLNKDIEVVVLHHTSEVGDRSITELNDTYIQAGSFGIPYDCVIMRSGKISIGPRWMFATNVRQLLVDVPTFYLRRFSRHYPAGVLGESGHHLTGFHLAVEGTFGDSRPTPLQFAVLDEVVTELAGFLPNLRDVILHSDIEVTECPGFTYSARLPVRVVEEVSDITQFAPIPPVPYFVIQSVTSTTVTTEWGNLPSEWQVDHFALYHSGQRSDIDDFDSWVKIAEVPANQNTYTDTTLLPGFLYSYKLVVALTNGRESDPMGPISTYTNPQGAWDAALGEVSPGWMSYFLAGAWKKAWTGNNNYPWLNPGDAIPGWLPVFDHRHFTVEFWLYLRSVSSSDVVFGRTWFGFLVLKCINLRIVSSFGNAYFKLQYGNPATAETLALFNGVSIPLHEWHHWAVTVNGVDNLVGPNTITLYKDGIPVQTVETFIETEYYFPRGVIPKYFDVVTGGLGSGADMSTFYVMIGGKKTPNGRYALDGIMDEFRYWMVERSDAEINANALTIIREHPYLAVRLGWDNFSHASPSYENEFGSLGKEVYNTVGYAGYFDTRRRIVEPAPELVLVSKIPVLIYPLNGDVVEQNPILQWTEASVYVSFQLQVSTVSNFSSTVIDVTGITNLYYQSSGLVSGVVYYWRVRMWDGSSWTYWPAWWSFTAGTYFLLLQLASYDVLATQEGASETAVQGSSVNVSVT